ncbi:hypothetical protein [Leptospira ilyithenensis]|uniref:Uncharacterized protein n=1 Tax=Leptospira ilyithenensis TaxID=2484901 RepID=A0A4V3JX12_9LEPT|nr:hypothetical protein [Leptospira ilyithenensis]TGN09754.1 hypothetical protein EHS11_11775 [Leptospira ilyithenensis]
MFYRILIFAWIFIIFAVFNGINPTQWDIVCKITFTIFSSVLIVPVQLDFEKKERPSDILKKNLSLILELYNAIVNPFPKYQRTEEDKNLDDLVFYHVMKAKLDKEEPEYSENDLKWKNPGFDPGSQTG